MRQLFALILVFALWVGVAPSASAESDVSGLLVPCRDSEMFAQRAKDSVSATAADRFQKYADSGLLCGKDDGLPHLITDGRLNHAGEFIIPGLLFLYLAGWLGWAGRNYLQTVHKNGTNEYKEVQIDVPVAIQSFIAALFWPLTFVKQILTGEIQEDDSKIPVSPR
ncbi:Photosystem I reaction center subunit III [Phormidesmis priestleyi ULC007]|uniref:Photosystem I reaction center subunit III n=1 Tax=Phormidesmis priestleyi ULC007 TaxID=1920490 RepID=A0A2T1DM73_9CYAN|nr:Photosystem I reaction center subunit III [Phormidesmis priestleyi]PSB21576.1 Photosystem I reaction center subunit III [Phormidesmis priestleyi ULC007]PZO54617.1 MAG: Photosystem I reaction center subunit III [Phormidesmis priestleyi]